MKYNGATRLLPFVEPLLGDASIHDYRVVHPPTVDTVEMNAIYLFLSSYFQKDGLCARLKL